MQNINEIFQIYSLTNTLHSMDAIRNKLQRYLGTNNLMVYKQFD